MSTDAPTEVPRQSRDSGVANDAWARAARDLNDPNKTKQDTITSLNQSLESTHVLPGLTITGIEDNPNTPVVEGVHLEGSPGVKGPATYDPNNHILTYERTPVLPGSEQSKGPERVSVNMATGEETVAVTDRNGNTRTTTREYVGAPGCTTVVTSGTDGKGSVLQTEATNTSGATTVIQFTHNPDGSVTAKTQPNANNGAITPDAEVTNIPADRKPVIDPSTGVLAYKDGESTITQTPEGRKFLTDKNGNSTYMPRQGDNLWDISRDLLRVQYHNGQRPNPNPSEEEILNMSNSLSKLYPNGIKAGESINLGNTGLAELPAGLQPLAHAQSTFASDGNDPTKGQWKPKDGPPINIANIKPGEKPVVEGDVLKYTNSAGQHVEVDSTGRETTTMPNGMKVFRNKPGEAPVRYEARDGHVFEFHSTDNRWWYRENNGKYVPLDGPPMLDSSNGHLKVGERGWNTQHTFYINEDGSFSRMDF